MDQLDDLYNHVACLSCNICITDEQVRFYYSFTCKDNLYLVMEYLNGGDLYSLLKNLGCLDEDMARVYISEIVRMYIKFHLIV